MSDSHKRLRHRHYDEHKRDREAKRFYGSAAWRRARDAVLIRDNGLCQPCLRRKRITPANTVHHKDPLRKAWDKALDLDNLEAICPACHNREHASDRRHETHRPLRAPVVRVRANPERF